MRRLLASCDLRTAKGSRDFAILTLLARLGLRAGEVVALDLDDIAWSGGEVLVRGKASRLERLPLPADVGEAVAGYLTRGRPGGEERALFLRVLAPHRRITVGAISVVVHAACKRAGLDPIAAHRLRLRSPASCCGVARGSPEIGQLLRHRSAAVTSIYAKVDTAALRQLARPGRGARHERLPQCRRGLPCDPAGCRFQAPAGRGTAVQLRRVPRGGAGDPGHHSAGVALGDAARRGHPRMVEQPAGASPAASPGT